MTRVTSRAQQYIVKENCVIQKVDLLQSRDAERCDVAALERRNHVVFSYWFNITNSSRKIVIFSLTIND